MKDYNEMAQSVLARIDTERAKNRRRRRIALSGVSAVCILLAVSVLIGYMGRDGGNVGPALYVEAADLMDGITAEDIEGRRTDKAFKKNQMRLAVELFQHTAAASEGENMMISPLSIQLALAMTANGADGKTLSEMEKVLGGSISIDKLNEYLYTYQNALPSTEKTKLNIANSIWFRDTFGVNQAFLQTNADYYGAAAYRSPFDDQTVKDINNWVNQNTDGMIDEMVQSIDPDTMMYLINAIVFDGKWKATYSESDVIKSSFYAYNGTKQNAKYMYSKEEIYLDDGKATGFMKPYSGGDYSFAALLPNEGTDIYDYIAGLSGDGLRKTLDKAKSTKVHAYLPKFESDYSISLNGILSDMGMPTAFSMEADFSGISDIETFISEVLHKTHITVDENGTKAAAVTSVENTYKGVDDSYYVRLDRPFVYMIVDNKTNL
ncbi:MAG: serpin family protein, partial [Clostridia bacterium]|nr:serpin family protein [Clostridia bacterium]